MVVHSVGLNLFTKVTDDYMEHYCYLTWSHDQKWLWIILCLETEMRMCFESNLRSYAKFKLFLFNFFSQQFKKVNIKSNFLASAVLSHVASIFPSVGKIIFHYFVCLPHQTFVKEKLTDWSSGYIGCQNAKPQNTLLNFYFHNFYFEHSFHLNTYINCSFPSFLNFWCLGG